MEQRPGAGGHGRSTAHPQGRVGFDDLQGERSACGGRADRQSKLANVLFADELARRLPGGWVTANVLHPGLTRTWLGAETRWVQRRLVPAAAVPAAPGQGAAASVSLASAPELAPVTGC
jgi:retinol dehydrogenase 14